MHEPKESVWDSDALQVSHRAELSTESNADFRSLPPHRVGAGTHGLIYEET